MKTYEFPSIEIIGLATDDIITTSPGTEAPVKPDDDFSWEW